MINLHMMQLALYCMYTRRLEVALWLCQIPIDGFSYNREAYNTIVIVSERTGFKLHTNGTQTFRRITRTLEGITLQARKCEACVFGSTCIVARNKNIIS